MGCFVTAMLSFSDVEVAVLELAAYSVLRILHGTVTRVAPHLGAAVPTLLLTHAAAVRHHAHSGHTGGGSDCRCLWAVPHFLNRRVGRFEEGRRRGRMEGGVRTTLSPLPLPSIFLHHWPLPPAPLCTFPDLASCPPCPCHPSHCPVPTPPLQPSPTSHHNHTAALSLPG